MSPVRVPNRWGPLLASFAVAVLLMQLPWSGWLLMLRPDFLLIVVLYWTLHHPRRVGFSVAFFLGLLADFQEGAVFGQHAMAYVVAVYLVLFLRLRLLQFEPLQQAAQLFPVLLAAQLVVMLVGWIAYRPPEDLSILLPVLSGTVLWFAIALWQRTWRGKGMQESE